MIKTKTKGFLWAGTFSFWMLVARPQMAVQGWSRVSAVAAQGRREAQSEGQMGELGLGRRELQRPWNRRHA